MDRGKRRHDWVMTADILAMVHNCHCESKKSPREYVPPDLLPPEPKIRMSIADVKGAFSGVCK